MTPLARAAIVAAVALHLVVLVPFTVSAGLVAPLWAVLALGAFWVGAAIVLWRTARRRPLFTPAIPLINTVVLWATITMGEVWLGWSA